MYMHTDVCIYIIICTMYMHICIHLWSQYFADRINALRLEVIVNRPFQPVCKITHFRSCDLK